MLLFLWPNSDLSGVSIFHQGQRREASPLGLPEFVRTGEERPWKTEHPAGWLPSCCLLTLSAVGPALAGSTVCKTFVPAGLVEDEHWTVSNSPYCLNGSIQVSLLTIDPGVEVLSTGDYQIEVWTTITAIGTETQPIRFGVQKAGQCWQGLRFPNAPTGSALRNCIIEDA